MGWEHRRGRSYYYLSFRDAGRPRKRYLGAGPVAECYARLKSECEQQRQAERAALHAEQARIALADRALEEFRSLTALLVRATLLLAGLYEHHGEWRRPKHDRTSQGRSDQAGSPRPTAQGRPNGPTTTQR